MDGVATYDAASDAVSVFLVNRDAAEPVTLELALDGLGPMQIVEHVVLADDDPYARNTTNATRVEPRRVSPAAAIDGLHPVTLPPVSWSMLIVRQSTTLSLRPSVDLMIRRVPSIMAGSASESIPAGVSI